MPACDQVIDYGESRLRIAFRNGAYRLRKYLGPGKPESAVDRRSRYFIGRKANNLIKIRLRIPHRAFARTRQLTQSIVVNVDLLGVSYQLQTVKYLLQRYRAELKLLTTRQDRVRHLVQLGGRHDKNDVVRRLFESFQQRVKGGLRKLMHLVDNKDL